MSLITAQPAPLPPQPHEAPGGITVNNVMRSFGEVMALLGVSFTAPPGKVTALVGANGCGKSTVMLIVASLLAPHSGFVTVDGFDPATHSPEVRARVGWMPDQFGAWDSLTVSEVLEVAGRSHFMSPKDIHRRTVELLDRLDLRPLAGRPSRVLSRGQKQRLGLARTLMHSPSVLILDEPASGLDPASRRRLLNVVRETAAQGATVLISSHILSELEEMTDHVVFMDSGRTLEEASLKELAQRARPWRVSSLDEGALRSALESLQIPHEAIIPAAESPTGYAHTTITVRGEANAAQLLQDLASAKVPVVAFGPAAGRLESAYMSIQSGAREGAL